LVKSSNFAVRKALEESADWALLSRLCYHSNLQTSVFK